MGGEVQQPSADETDWVSVRQAKNITGATQADIERWALPVSAGGYGIPTRMDHDADDLLYHRPSMIELANRLDGLDRPADGHYAAAVARLWGFAQSGNFTGWASERGVRVWRKPASCRSLIQSDLYSLNEVLARMKDTVRFRQVVEGPKEEPPMSEPKPIQLAQAPAPPTPAKTPYDMFVDIILRAGSRTAGQPLVIEDQEVRLVIEALAFRYTNRS